VILRSCAEKRRQLPGERDHAGHCSRSKKARETKDAMGKWAKKSFEKVLRETDDIWRMRRLVHKATNTWNENG